MLSLMGRKQDLKILKVSLLVTLSLSFACTLSAQKWQLEKETQVSYHISAYALDQEGKMYLGSSDGNIYRYDSVGIEEQVFSNVNLSGVTLIEPWNRLKLFSFFRENQVIQVLNRFVTKPTEYFIQDLGVEFSSLAAPGVDNSFWIHSSNFNELRKYSGSRLTFSTPLTGLHIPEPAHLRAYQNLIILLDAKTGFYFFDQFGNLAYSLPIKGASYFQIYREKVYLYANHQILIFDPYFIDEIERIETPDEPFIAILKSENKFIFLKETGFSFYSLKD